MAIKSLTSVMIDNEYMIAQFDSDDGSPTGVGLGVLMFLRDKMKRKIFLDKVKKVRYLTKKEEMDIRLRKEEEIYKLYPYLNLAGDDLLEFVQKVDDEIILRDEREFVRDSIFCEYAYIIDFDIDTFEIYIGEQRKSPPAGERFADLQPLPECPEYHPVHFLIGFNLSNLPTDDEYKKVVKEAYDLKRKLR